MALRTFEGEVLFSMRYLAQVSDVLYVVHSSCFFTESCSYNGSFAVGFLLPRGESLKSPCALITRERFVLLDL
ncbi:hypothetical protein YC2023_007059 [Brassica napus]